MEKFELSMMMAESQQQFRRQFDPNSICFHNGDPTVVPLNGQRIPQTMPTVYPQNYDPNQNTTQRQYGEQYKKIEMERSILMNLKKSLGKLCPIKEAFLRHQAIFAEKGNPKNEKHVQLYKSNIRKQSDNLKEVQKELEQFLIIFKDQHETVDWLNEILKESVKDLKDKQSLTEFNFKVKRLSTKSFSQAQKCLQQLKRIKKEVENKEKTLQKTQTEAKSQ